MSQLSALPFEEYVQQVLAEHKGERVYHFTYNDKDFWLKQPEQLHGVWHFLKRNKPLKTKFKVCNILRNIKRRCRTLKCLVRIS